MLTTMLVLGRRRRRRRRRKRREEEEEEEEEVYVGVRLLREEGVSERASERVRGLETPRRGNFSIWLLFFLSLGKTPDSSPPPSAVNLPLTAPSAVGTAGRPAGAARRRRRLAEGGDRLAPLEQAQVVTEQFSHQLEDFGRGGRGEAEEGGEQRRGEESPCTTEHRSHMEGRTDGRKGGKGGRKAPQKAGEPSGPTSKLQRIPRPPTNGLET